MYVTLKPALLKRAALTLLLLAAALPVTRAQSFQDKGTCAYGASFSPTAIGISFHSPGRRDSFKKYDTTIELMDVINGRFSTPGYRFAYHHAVILNERELPSGQTYRIYSGPGMTVGYVREKGTKRGMMAGISACLGGSVALRHNIFMSLEWQLYAAFLFTDPESPKMQWYDYGVDGAWIPRLIISKHF